MDAECSLLEFVP